MTYPLETDSAFSVHVVRTVERDAIIASPPSSTPPTPAPVACGTTAADGTFPCTASLPQMTAGLHSLTLAVQETGGAQLISSSSAAIQLLDLLLGPRAASTFESTVDPSGAVFYWQQRIAGFANDLFIAALNGRHLHRVHFDRSDPKRIDVTEHLFDGVFGRISDVAVAPDGSLYLSTSNAGTTSAAAGDDRLLRVTTGNRAISIRRTATTGK